MLPDLFLERLKRILMDRYSDVLKTFELSRPLSVRINNLKSNNEEVLSYCLARGINVRSLPWSTQALILDNQTSQDLSRDEIVTSGKIYMQSLSSMLPVLVLDPAPTEKVLDLCAAPGSKTTQLAALMRNQGNIIAVESVRPRFYRLKSVLQLMGVGNVQAKCVDGRRFRTSELFDKILVDTPCSSESRFKTFDQESSAYWSPRKIKEMVQKQRGLLLNACRLLKPGGVLVYSTCTFAPEENEGVIDWLFRKMPEGLTLEPIHLEGVASYPALRQWDKRNYDDRVAHCFRVLPTELMEGFFMAKIVRV